MYGLTLLVAIAACVAADRLPLDERRGGDWDLVLRVAVWGVAAGIVGARLYHVITSWNDVPDPKWKGVFEVWEGGLGVWGGILFGGVVGAIVVQPRGRGACRDMMDAVAPALLLAQAIGRFGNWWNQELYGKPTDLPWGLEIDPTHRVQDYAHDDDVPPDLPLRGRSTTSIGVGRAAAASTGGGGSGRPRSSRSTSPGTRSAASSRSCCGSTRRTSSGGCG